ncbi:MAG: peroxiredoxin [Bacteroidales bacterium]|nr:peroxiredoxin [Bacteroidales bacterium]
MKISIGSPLPPFRLPDQEGKMIDSTQLVGERPLVLYFYPKDDSPGCTAQACSFRDAYHDFIDAGAQVVGVSSDDSSSHKDFAEKHRLPFTLLSDQDGKLRREMGVPSDLLGLLPGRVTYVIDRHGIIRHIFKSQLNAKRHISEALAALARGT